MWPHRINHPRQITSCTLPQRGSDVLAPAMAESRSDLRETLRARARTLVQQESGEQDRAPLPSALSSEREPLERTDSFSAQLASFRSGAKTSATSRLRRASIDITTQAKARAQEAVRAELSRGSVSYTHLTLPTKA